MALSPGWAPETGAGKIPSRASGHVRFVPKADILATRINVRVGPEADIRMSLSGSGLMVVQRKIHLREICYVKF